MQLHSLPGTDLTLSTFCYGLGDLFALPQNESDRLLDTFVEAGGNFFDTAHCYSFWLPGGNGQSELGLGDYLRRRGLKGATVATKGGHPSARGYRQVDRYLSPGRLAADIDDSLGRLQCDTIPLFYLHRDDPRVPASEIIEALNIEVRSGRIRYLGASNWTSQRIEEANAHATANNLQPFAISEPLWSLATVKSKGDPTMHELNGGDIAWHRKTLLPAAPYTPTAHGFFGGASARTDSEYSTPENHGRRERVTSLARERKFAPAQIALAWLISHPFPVFPILGTKNPERLREALAADSIQLSEKELAWIDQG